MEQLILLLSFFIQVYNTCGVNKSFLRSFLFFLVSMKIIDWRPFPVTSRIYAAMWWNHLFFWTYQMYWHQAYNQEKKILIWWRLVARACWRNGYNLNQWYRCDQASSIIMYGHHWVSVGGLAMHIYIYIYICVCVCVCVWERERERDRDFVYDHDQYLKRISIRKKSLN